MTEEQYKSELKEIEDNYESNKRKLYLKYANSKRIYNLGDIIKDHHQTIIIERFGVDKMFGLPRPIYIGTELRKDLTPKKSHNIGYVYGNEKTSLIKPSNHA